MNQRRRYERFAADIPCRLYIPGDKRNDPPRFEAFLRVKDLSFGGVFIKSGFQFKEDQQIMVELKLPDEDLPVRGRIARKVDGGMGIAFEELSKKAREALLRHFVPDEHRRFHATLADVMPGMPVDRVSLILHLWDDWQHELDAGKAPRGPSARR